MSKISLEGLNKADVLAALYNASRPQGLGFVQYDPTPMSSEQAQAILDGGQTGFDYLAGRVMKVDLSGDELETGSYDRDNGAGQAQNVIDELRHSADPNSAAIQSTHTSGRLTAAELTLKHLGDKSGLNAAGHYELGLDDVADVLRPSVHKALGQ